MQAGSATPEGSAPSRTTLPDSIATTEALPAASPMQDAETPAGSVPRARTPILSGSAEIPAPPDRDYYKLAAELIPGLSRVEKVVRERSPDLVAGHTETFTIVDLEATETYEEEMELRLVTPHAYWFVGDAVDASDEDLERTAEEFEEVVYPRVTSAFGTEWTPGVDGDPHLFIIIANLRGVGGYYNSADEYPGTIRPISNEHEAIYINARYLPVGSKSFSMVLAHELQHAVHWNHDPTEETWVGEGLVRTGGNHRGIRTDKHPGLLAGGANLADKLAGGG